MDTCISRIVRLSWLIRYAQSVLIAIVDLSLHHIGPTSLHQPYDDPKRKKNKM